MATMDIFEGDAFTIVELTRALEDLIEEVEDDALRGLKAMIEIHCAEQ